MPVAGDDQDGADRAFCSRCAVLIELDRGADQIPKLKEILLRSDNDRNRFHAAYCTAVAYDLSGDTEKATSYADRASTLAAELDCQRIDDRHEQTCAVTLPAHAVEQRLVEARVVYNQHSTPQRINNAIEHDAPVVTLADQGVGQAMH